MRILLILLAALPILAVEERELHDLSSELQRFAEELQHDAGEVSRAAIAAEVGVPPAFSDFLRRTRDELLAADQSLTGPTAEVIAKARTVFRQGSEVESRARFVVSQIEMIFKLDQSFARPVVSPLPRQCLERMRAMAVALMVRVADGAPGSVQSPADELRWHQLHLATRMVRSEVFDRPLLPAGEPPRSEFLAWVRAARTRVEAELAEAPAGDDAERERQLLRLGQALHLPEQRLELWDGLLADSERRRASERPPYSDADGPGLPALRRTLDQQIEARRQCLALLADKEALSSEVYSEFERVMSGRNQLEDAERIAMGAIEWQREIAGRRKGLPEQLGKCVEQVRKNIQNRFDQIVAEAGKYQVRQLKAAGDGDRIDVLEAEGELELVKLRLAALIQELETEVWLAEGEAPWRAKAKEPDLRELVQRQQKLREKLVDAHAKQLKAQLQQQQVRNRIAMLELKAELTSAQMGEAENAAGRLRSELDQLHQELGEAAAKAGERAKNAKDAERIPLVKPGVDDF